MNKEVFLEIYSLIVFDTEPGEAIFLDKTALDVMYMWAACSQK